jgi:short-subunit dehydrogenase
MSMIKTIWIIGAGSGIGKSMAIKLAQQGHRLLLSGRRLEQLHETQLECGSFAEVFPMDASSQSDWKNSYQLIKSKYGVPDSIIMMAGTYDPMSVDKIDYSTADKTVQINLMSSLYMLATVASDMKLRGAGQIVFCGSVAGYRGLPNAQPYSCTKAALINLAETARLDLSGDGIDVKIINPGFVKTDMTDKNSFTMPMIISSDMAAEKIVKQLFNPSAFEIRTHGFFTLMMKFIRLLPNWVFFRALSTMK